MDGKRVGWTELGMSARLFRIAHAVWGGFNLAGLGYLAWSASTRRRDGIAFVSAAVLGAEGVALVIGRGDCPFGPFQASLGDPVPMFELTVKGAEIAYIEFSGPRNGEFLAADEIRFRPVK